MHQENRCVVIIINACLSSSIIEPEFPHIETHGPKGRNRSSPYIFPRCTSSNTGTAYYSRSTRMILTSCYLENRNHHRYAFGLKIYRILVCRKQSPNNILVFKTNEGNNRTRTPLHMLGVVSKKSDEHFRGKGTMHCKCRGKRRGCLSSNK